MRTLTIHPQKIILGLFTVISTVAATAQDFVVEHKDETRPEVTNRNYLPAQVSAISAIRNGDYVEIRFNASAQQDTRKYTVEYSTNGVTYLTAGEATVTNSGQYSLKHQTTEFRSLLYRVRIEAINGKYFYSNNSLLDGVDNPPVKIYPTIITGNLVNVNAYLPIEKIVVVDGSGRQVYAQDVNGRADYMGITVPSLGKGMYWMAFTGNGWKSTSKFIVP